MALGVVLLLRAIMVAIGITADMGRQLAPTDSGARIKMPQRSRSARRPARQLVISTGVGIAVDCALERSPILKVIFCDSHHVV